MKLTAMISKLAIMRRLQVIEEGERLLGLMPAVLDGSKYTGFTAGCYLATSTNGLDWTAPRLLFPSWAIGPRVEVSRQAKRYSLFA